MDAEIEIEVFTPSPERIFQPFSPDGNPALLPSVSEYILRRARAIPGHSKIRVKVRASESGSQTSEMINVAICSYFLQLAQFEKESLQRSLRHGLVFLSIGLVLVVLLGSLAAFLRPLAQGNFVHGLVESLVILGWVALWRPADVLLYEWIPAYRNIRLLRRLSSCKTQVVLERA